MVDNYIKVSCVCTAAQGRLLEYPSDECRTPMSEKVARRRVALSSRRPNRSVSELFVLSWVFPFSSEEDGAGFRLAREQSGTVQMFLFSVGVKPVRSWFKPVAWCNMDLVVVGENRAEGQVTS
jgi:hypothetical protein